MSTEKKDILSWAGAKDGQFKRQVSAFRDQVQEGTKFEPEKGESLYLTVDGNLLNRVQVVTTFMYRWLAPGPIGP